MGLGRLRSAGNSKRRRLRIGCVTLAALALAACGSADGPPSATGGTDPAAAADVRAPSADAPLVIAFGDSLYAGYNLGADEGLAPQLQAALMAQGLDVRVQNAGVSGDTTAAGLARLTFVLDGAGRPPALVLLGLGGNDMLRGIDAAQTRANLTAMMDELTRRKIPVVLTGMLAPPNMGDDYVRAYNAIYPDLARAYGAGLYPFILNAVFDDPALMLDDGIHPNAKGVAKIVAGLAPLVREGLPDTAGT